MFVNSDYVLIQSTVSNILNLENFTDIPIMCMRNQSAQLLKQSLNDWVQNLARVLLNNNTVVQKLVIEQYWSNVDHPKEPTSAGPCMPIV